MSVTKNLQHSLPRKSLVTIYKAFLRPLIDYGDIICAQLQHESFYKKLKPVQYKPALATEVLYKVILMIRSIKN